MTTTKLFVIEALYESDRHGNTYWGPIMHPRAATKYAIFTDKAKAENIVTKLKADEDLAFEVGIMGNDFPIDFRISKQSA
jgi:hypothetical protein